MVSSGLTDVLLDVLDRSFHRWATHTRYSIPPRPRFSSVVLHDRGREGVGGRRRERKQALIYGNHSSAEKPRLW
jgi:hypothetical protein